VLCLSSLSTRAYGAFKFLNLEWGITPEQAIELLKNRVNTLKEDPNIKAEEKAIGIRIFKSNKDNQKELFAEINWDFIRLIFLDNKLSEVELYCEGLDYYKLKKELETRFGSPERHDRIPKTMTIDFWTAEDKSTFTLSNIDAMLNIQDVTIASFIRPQFETEKTQLLKEHTRSAKSEWDMSNATSKSNRADTSGPFVLMENNWGKSSAEIKQALWKSQQIELSPDTDLSIEEKAINGLQKYRGFKFEFEGFYFSLNAGFLDDKLASVTLLDIYDIGRDNIIELAQKMLARYGKDFSKSPSEEDQRIWKLADGSEVELFIFLNGTTVSVRFKSPGYDKELSSRKGRVIKK
jgi:hypothetical protein